MQQGGQLGRRRTWVAEHIGRCKDGLLLLALGQRGSVSVEDLSTGRRQRDVTLLLLVSQREKLSRGVQQGGGGGTHPEDCEAKQTKYPQEADASVDPLRIGLGCLSLCPGVNGCRCLACSWLESRHGPRGWGRYGWWDAFHGEFSTLGRGAFFFVVRPQSEHFLCTRRLCCLLLQAWAPVPADTPWLSM